MSRHQRRQESRRGKQPFPWEKLIVSAIAIFFVGTVAFTYFFPAINARSYATGSARVQRIILSRGVEDLQKQGPFEFIFATNQYPFVVTDEDGDEQVALSWNEFQVKETSTGLVFTEGEVVTEYTLQTPPEYYRTVSNTIADLEVALKDKLYKVRHPQPEEKEARVLILEKLADDTHTGYLLYFTEEHKIDTIHSFELFEDDSTVESIYSGLITGIPEGYGEEEPSDEESDD